MQVEDFVCYSKNDDIKSIGLNLNNLIAKNYYSKNVLNGGGFRKNLNMPLPLVLLNHENSFLKETVLNKNQKGGQKKKNKCDVIPDSLFEKLIELKSNSKKKQTKKIKGGGNKRKKKKTKKLTIF